MTTSGDLTADAFDDRLDEFSAYRAWRLADDQLQAFVAGNPLPLDEAAPAWTDDQRRGFAQVVQAEVAARAVLEALRSTQA